MSGNVCINCGAAISFEQAGGELVERLVCPFCGAANLRAQAERLARLELERAAQRETAGRRRFFAFVGGGVAALLVLIGVIQLQRASASLDVRYADLERARAQVANVKERQASVVALQKDAPPSTERDAELAGAENRVRIERGRYDVVAAAYNAELGGVFATLAARLKGLPPEAVLSNEVRW